MLDDIRRLLVRDLEAFQRELELFPDDETVWQTVPGITNSVGTLALHVCGNLQHFIGAVLGQTGSIRDRAAEFRRRGDSRAALIRELRQTAEVVTRTLMGLPVDAVGTVYPVAVSGLTLRTDRFLFHLSTYLAFHLGQAGYLRRIVTREERSVGAMALASLVDAP